MKMFYLLLVAYIISMQVNLTGGENSFFGAGAIRQPSPINVGNGNDAVAFRFPLSAFHPVCGWKFYSLLVTGGLLGQIVGLLGSGIWGY